ncbi:MAG: glycosyltransferase family 4 protein [Thermoplasmata archaeon]
MTTRFAVVRGVARINLPEVRLYSTLQQHGLETELICSRRARISSDDVGMPIHRLPVPALSGRLAPTLAGGYLIGLVSPYRYYHQYLRGFHQAVREVDILCPVDLGHPTSYQSILERRYGKKVLVQCWDNIPFNWPHDRPLRFHFEAVLDQADHFLALTEDARRTLSAMGVSSLRVSRLNVGLDLDFWRPDPAARSEGGPLKILFVGRFDWGKGLQALLEALDLVTVPFELTIVGTGPERARLDWLIEQRRKRSRVRWPDAVHFVGPQYGMDLLRLRQGSDVQVVPSIPTPQWREQISQSLLEGMACGLPPIASRTGAVREAVTDGETGLLVPPDDPLDLAAAIDRMAEHPEERRRFAANGRARMEQDFNLRLQADRLAAIVQSQLLG